MQQTKMKSRDERDNLENFGIGKKISD